MNESEKDFVLDDDDGMDRVALWIWWHLYLRFRMPLQSDHSHVV